MEENQLAVVVKEQNLEPTQSDMLLKKFSGFFEEASKWEKEAMAIQITDESQVEEMSKAREIRLALKDIRVNADKVRVGLKEGIIRQGKAIDGVANVIKALIVPLEEHLEKQEKFIENAIKEKEEKKLADRTERLLQYVEDISFYNLKDMSDNAFEVLLSNSKMIFDKKKEDEKIAEEKRIEQQKKIDLFNARKIMIAPYSFFFDAVEEKLTEDMSDAQFKSYLTKLSHVKKEYDDDQEKIRIENEKMSQTLKRIEELRSYKYSKIDFNQDEISKMNTSEFDKLRYSIIESDRKESERIKKEENDKIAKETQEKKEKEEKEEKERQAKLAPEKDKLLAYAETIRTIQAPADLSKAGLEIVKQVEAKLLAISQEIKSKVKEL